MVSLNGNTRQTGQGGMTFFSDSLSSYHDDDPLLDAGMPALPRDDSVPRWLTQEIKKFRTIRTPKAIVLAMLFYVGLVLSAFLLPKFCGEGHCGGQEPTSLVLYVHGGSWFLFLLVHMYLSQEHRSSLLHGYFAFHLDTRCLRRFPLHVSSGANAVLVVVSRILAALCQPDGSCGALSKAAYLQIIISLEAFIALIALFVFFMKTLHFNKEKNVPDFLRSSLSNDTPRIQHDIGFRTPWDLQRWAMEQCWEDVYHLRRTFGYLVEHRSTLTHHLHHCLNVSSSVSVN